MRRHHMETMTIVGKARREGDDGAGAHARVK